MTGSEQQGERGRPAVAARRGQGDRGGAGRRLLRVARLVLLLWGIWLGIALVAQESILFPAHLAAGKARPRPAGIELVVVEAEPGVRVEGWFRAGDGRSADAPGPALMVFHGNAELIDEGVRELEQFRRRGISVLLCEYRGYGRSGGRPGQRGIARDMQAFRDWLDARPDVDPTRVVYLGRSLGGGVAMDLARTRPPAAVILTSTFSSVRAMFHRNLVPGWVCRHPFDSLEVIRGLEAPVLIVHGDADGVVPIVHGRRLAAAAREALLVEIPGAGHVLPTTDPMVRPHVMTFLDRTLAITATAAPGTAGGSDRAPSTR